MIERVCVAGAGAIGSLYAGHLGQVAETSVLVRRPEHAEALNAHGLRVTGKSDLHASVRAATDPGDLPEPDLVIVATKANEVEAVARRLAGHFPRATVMTIQNGLGAEELVRRHGDWPLISAITFMSGKRHGDAEVEYELDTPTWIGPYAGTSTPFEPVREVHELLLLAGLRSEALQDLRPAQWSKLIFNATVNAVSALTDLPHVALFAKEDEFGDLGHLVHDLMDEGVAVAAAVGVELHEDPWEMNVLAVRRGETQGADYAHRPSMLEDVEARRPTEIDFITGALVREAERVGVPAPLHTALLRLVKGREASWKPEWSPTARPLAASKG